MQQTLELDAFEQIGQQMERTARQIVRQHFSHFRTTDAWSPAVNIYQLGDRIEICVELAGVEKESIQLHAEPGLLVICGNRSSPHPPRKPGAPMHILAMEIDHGPFERRVALPQGVEIDRITTEQSNGLLWVRLPLLRRER